MATREQDGHFLSFYPDKSADIGHLPLGLRLSSRLWLSRQLKNGCLLALPQVSEQHDLAVRKFQCVVMNGNFFGVDLSEYRRLVHDDALAPS